MGQHDPEYTAMEYNTEVDGLLASEYPMLQGKTYMDHGGTTVYAKSLIDNFAADMNDNLYGNPHSASTPANFSSRVVDETRERTLRFFGADPKDFDLIFVANATAAIKLVMDCFKDLTNTDGASTPPTVSGAVAPSEGGFWYAYHVDSHNSLIGVRECSDNYHLFRTDAEVESWLSSPSLLNPAGKLGLFAYPGQSNMTGRRLPLSWPARLRASSDPTHSDTYTLFDAAALATTAPLHGVFADPARAPDFTALSFYKVFGFPDLGGLIVRKASGRILASGRRYFGGGTVSLVTVHGAHPWHESRDASILHEALEDGTLPFHSIVALSAAIGTHERLYGPDPMTRISRHANFLGKRLYDGLRELRHANGQAVCRIYGGVSGKSVYGDARTQGATISFNVRDANGAWVPYTSAVERAADKRGIYVRSGQLCNPGGVAMYLGLERWHVQRLWAYGHRCGEHERSGTEIYHGKPTGVVRVSMGAMTTIANVDAVLDFLREEYVMETPKSIERPMILDERLLQPLKKPMTLEESISLVIRVRDEEGSLDDKLETPDTKSEGDNIEADHLETPELLEIQESSESQDSQSDQKSSDILPRSFTSSITQVNSNSPPPEEKETRNRYHAVSSPTSEEKEMRNRYHAVSSPTSEEKEMRNRYRAVRSPTFDEKEVRHRYQALPSPTFDEKEVRHRYQALPSPTSEEKEQLAIRFVPRPPRPEEKKASTVYITSVQGLELMKSQISSRSSSRAGDLRKKEEHNGLKKLLSHKMRPKRSTDVMGMI